MAKTNASILQLKVVLRGTRPPIWRRVLVPSNVTLDRLHQILQTVMGWTDSHLHEFRAGDTRYGTPDRDWDEDEEVLSERRVRLGVRQFSGDYPRPNTPGARRHASLVRRLLRCRSLRYCGNQPRIPRRLGPAAEVRIAASEGEARVFSL